MGRFQASRVVAPSKVSQQNRLAFDRGKSESNHDWLYCSKPPAAGGCSCPWLSARMARQGTWLLPSSARRAQECCQGLHPWLIPALLHTAAFQPALVFMGLSHETCSSIKCQKTIIFFLNWLNSLPFKHIKLAHHGDLKMPKPAKRGRRRGRRAPSACQL